MANGTIRSRQSPDNDRIIDHQFLTLVLDFGIDRSGKPIGLPYGSYARFILLFLQSQAIRSRSREVELGRSMRVWLGSMGLFDRRQHLPHSDRASPTHLGLPSDLLC